MKQRNELSAPLKSDLESTIKKKVKLTLPGKYYWKDENKEIDLKINIYKINECLIPIYDNQVLTPAYYNGIYSIKNLNQGMCKELESNEIMKCLYENPNDLFIIDRGVPRISVMGDLNRLSKRLQKGISESDWYNLAMQLYNKGLID